MKYFLLLFLSLPLVVLGDTRTPKNIAINENVQEVVTGDIAITGGKSRALGLGRSSFDVDINQCMGSTAWDTIIGGKQKLVINWVCLAEFYLKTGQPELAATAICNTEMLDEFSSEAECEAAHDFFIEVAEAIEIAVVDDQHREEEEEWHQEQQQMQQDYDDRIAFLESQPIQKQAYVPPDLDDRIEAAASRRAKSRAALAEYNNQ